MPHYTKSAKAIARTALTPLLPPGALVRTILRHVSRSGMTRDIALYVVADGKLRDITYDAAVLLESSIRNGGIRVGGAGMDMGFHLVYSLSRTLYPEGFHCIGELGACPANDHVNDWGTWAREFDLEHAAEWEAIEARRIELRSHPHPDLHTAEAVSLRADREAYVAARARHLDARRAEAYNPKRVHTDGGYALRQSWL